MTDEDHLLPKTGTRFIREQYQILFDSSGTMAMIPRHMSKPMLSRQRCTPVAGTLTTVAYLRILPHPPVKSDFEPPVQIRTWCQSRFGPLKIPALPHNVKVAGSTLLHCLIHSCTSCNLLRMVLVNTDPSASDVIAMEKESHTNGLCVHACTYVHHFFDVRVDLPSLLYYTTLDGTHALRSDKPSSWSSIVNLLP
ncbi:hypothetical protein TNCV_5103651 [Trichonephila clavipes]|nr:hypothetical protein TNCV_5103651 [Trichonephila clavipes]